VGKCQPFKVFLPKQITTFTYNIKGGLKYQDIPNGFSFFPHCDYDIEYTSSFSNGTALPEWIIFDTRQRQWFAVNLDDS
jgi:hypothetical protein